MDVLEKIKQNGNQSAALLPEILGGVTLNLLKIDFSNKKLIFEAGTLNIAKDLLSAVISGDKNIEDINVNLVLKPYEPEKKTAKMNALSILGKTDWPGGPISKLSMSFIYPENSGSNSSQTPTFINLIINQNSLSAYGQDFSGSAFMTFTIEYV